MAMMSVMSAKVVRVWKNPGFDGQDEASGGSESEAESPDAPAAPEDDVESHDVDSNVATDGEGSGRQTQF